MSRDEAYLLDILLASRDVVSYLQGLDYKSFKASSLHQDAVVRKLEIVGEAAKNLSDDAKAGIQGFHGDRCPG